MAAWGRGKVAKTDRVIISTKSAQKDRATRLRETGKSEKASRDTRGKKEDGKWEMASLVTILTFHNGNVIMSLHQTVKSQGLLKIIKDY